MSKVLPLLPLVFASLPLSALAHPGYGLETDSKGNAYFTDVHTKTVWKLEAEGELTPLVKDVWAHALCVDAADRVWIEVEVNNTQYSVLRVDSDGGDRTRILGPMERGLEFHGASFLADAEGNLFYPHSDPPNFWNLGVRRRASDGTTTLIAGGDEPGDQDGAGHTARFRGIDSMRFDPEGRILVLDVDRIRRVDRDGTVTTLARDLRELAPEHQPFNNGNPRVSNRLYGFDAAPDGRLVVAYHGNRRVWNIDPEGEQTVLYQSEAPWSPVGVCFDGTDVLIKESALEPGSDRTGPRIRRLGADGLAVTLVELNDGRPADLGD